MDQPGASPTPSPLRCAISTVDQTLYVDVGGRADFSNLAQLTAALGTADLGTANQVVVRLADLEFCDVRAFSELIAFARGAKRRGLVCCLQEPAPWLRVLVQLFDLDGDLGVAAAQTPDTEGLLLRTREFDPLRDIALSDERTIELLAAMICADPGESDGSRRGDSLEPG